MPINQTRHSAASASALVWPPPRCGGEHHQSNFDFHKLSALFCERKSLIKLALSHILAALQINDHDDDDGAGVYVEEIELNRYYRLLFRIRLVPAELCSPSPCGSNSKCDVINNVPTCSCLSGYVVRRIRVWCVVYSWCGGGDPNCNYRAPHHYN